MAAFLASIFPAPSLTITPSSSTKPASPRRCRARYPNGRWHSMTSSATPPLRLELARRHLLPVLPLLYPFFTNTPAFGLLEADDDEQLLQKMKEDRRRKIQKREELNVYRQEIASLQTAIYKLSKTGQALDGDDFRGISSVLGTSVDVGWIVDVRAALSKMSSSDEERSEVKTFNSALSSLQSAVLKQDLESSKKSFVVSASALEKWSSLTGLAQFLKGL